MMTMSEFQSQFAMMWMMEHFRKSLARTKTNQHRIDNPIKISQGMCHLFCMVYCSKSTTIPPTARLRCVDGNIKWK